MNKPCKTGNWQGERERRLHRACLLMQAAVSRGETVRKAARRMAGRYHDRPFKCEPARRMALSWLTLRGHFYRWKRGGKVAAVFASKYMGGRSVFTAWMLIRFLNFIVQCPQPSLKAAFENFTVNGRGFRTGRRGAKPVGISLGQLRHHFRGGNFNLIREQQRALAEAQRKLGGLALAIGADFQARYPESARRRKATDFQI